MSGFSKVEMSGFIDQYTLPGKVGYMKKQDIIMVRTKELKKLHIVRKFIEKQIKQTEAAKVLGISTRQVRRIAARLKAEGDSSIVHRLRGKKSNNATSESARQKVVTLYKKN